MCYLGATFLNLEDHVARLTKRSVETAPTHAKDYVLWDDTLKGFGLRVQPSGHRSYIVQYRVGGGRRGRTRKATLGRHGTLSPEQARDAARRWLAEVADGRDPAAEKSDARAAPNVTELCDRYLETHALIHKKPSSVYNDRSSINNHILPLIGNRKVVDVTTMDIDRLLRDVSLGNTKRNVKTGKHGRSIVRGGRTIANRVRSLLSKMFNLAERWGWRADGSNPVRHSQRNKEHARERYLSPDELARLGNALDRAERECIALPEAVAVIRFLALTGCRRGEALNLRWDYIDFERRLARLPDSKTGPKTLRLPAGVMAMLSEMATVRTDNPYVFPGKLDSSPLTDITTPWNRIRLLAGLTDFRMHDLRHTHASIGVSAGLSLPIIGKLLGHHNTATTQRYAHLADDPVAEASDMIGESIQRAMETTGAKAGKVVRPQLDQWERTDRLAANDT